jgi:hypothetical protein
VHKLLFSPAIYGRGLKWGNMVDIVNLIVFMTHDAILTTQDEYEFEKTNPILKTAKKA